MVPRAEWRWKAYSLGTGFVADVAALAASAALSEDVSATVGGVVIAAAIVEAAYAGSDLLFERSYSRMRAASTPEEEGASAVAGLVAVVFGGVWIVAGVAVSDWLVPSFDISGFWPYVGTVAFMFAASMAIYLPLYLGRTWRQMRRKPN